MCPAPVHVCTGVVRVNGYTVREGQECDQHLCMSVQRSGEG